MPFKKTILLFIIFTFVFQGVGVSFVFKRAQAGLPVSIIALSPIVLLEEAKSEIATQTFIKKVIDFFIEVVKEYLRIRLLDYLVGQTVAWINNGFKGGPYFVTNFEDFLLEAGVNAVGDYLAQSKYKQICSPFDYSIRLNLGGFQQMPSTACTLDWVVNDIERYWGDNGFFEGGLAAFGESLKMQNNIYGANMIAERELEVEVMREITLKEAFGSQAGFQNTRRCVQTYTDIETGVRTCLKWQITTPGGVIAGKLQKALNVDIDKILSADEFTTYAAAIIDALINQLIKAGMNGLFGLADGGGSADPGDIPDLPPLLYVCNKTAFVCRPVFEDDDMLKGVRETYSTADECNEKCVDDTDPDEGGKTYNDNLLACEKGIFVRARPPEKCSNGSCSRCTGIGGIYASDPCFVFCKHTKDAEWKSGVNNGKQFSEGEVNSVTSFFGLSSPAGGCFCQTKIGDYPFYDYDGVGHFTLCLECNDETLFGAKLCKSTSWCENPDGSNPPQQGETDPCCVGLDVMENELIECKKISDNPQVCVDKEDEESVVNCYKLACPIDFNPIQGKCVYQGKLKDCLMRYPEPNSVCVVSTDKGVKVMPCEGFIKN